MQKPTLKKVFFFVSSLLLLYSLLGFIVLPQLISHQLPKLAKDQLNRDLQFDELKFNPFSMELDIQGFKVKKTNDNSFFDFQRLYINIAVLRSIVNLTLTIDQIHLKQPKLFIIRNQHGEFNFSDLLTSQEPKEAEDSSTNIFPLSILQMSISEGKLSWRDDYYSHKQEEDIHPINLNILNFTTVPQQQSDLEISVSTSSGGRLDWRGKLELSPLNSSGYIKLDKVDFHRVWELFLQDNVKFDLFNGTETFEGEYELTDTAAGIQLHIKNARLAIHDFQLTEKNSQQPLISIPDFSISGINVNLLDKDITINDISSKNAQFKAWLDTDGQLNYQSLFTSNTEKKPIIQQEDAANDDPDKPWHVTVNQLAMNNFALQFTDKSLQKPAQLKLTSLNLNLSDITTDPKSSLPFKLEMTINDSGHLKLEGKTILQPFSSHLQVDLKNLAIKDFQPYLNEFARLNIVSGLLNVNVDVAISQEEDKPFGLSFQGNTHITDFVSQTQVSTKDFLKWKKLSFNKMDIDLAANSYMIDTVSIEQPYGSILIKKDKTIDVGDILIQKNPKQKPRIKQKPEVKQKKPVPTYSITHFDIINGESDFADFSLFLPFAIHINQLNGSVKGISSAKDAVIKATLTGRADDLVPINIKGIISPQQGNSEFELDFKNMPLPLVTPYMAEFAGRKIEKGNMSLGLMYKIKNGLLTASNNLLIDQLTLGEKVDHPKAVSLPLDLAIALLEDTNGKIMLDVPITGTLDDPQFSVSSIIFDALVNVITKVVTAPFTAIASLIGSDEDISTIVFSPGKTTLNAAQKEKLNGLAYALTQRTGLILEIKGAAYTEHDWPHLQAEALDKQLAQINQNKLNQKNDIKESSKNITVSDKQYQELLADLFIQKFPLLGERTLFGTPRLVEPLKGDFYEFAKTKLAEIIPPNPQRLRKLASSRAKTIAKHMVDQKIPLERVYLLTVDVDPEKTNDAIETTLSLTVN